MNIPKCPICNKYCTDIEDGDPDGFFSGGGKIYRCVFSPERDHSGLYLKNQPTHHYVGFIYQDNEFIALRLNISYFIFKSKTYHLTYHSQLKQLCLYPENKTAQKITIPFNSIPDFSNMEKFKEKLSKLLIFL